MQKFNAFTSLNKIMKLLLYELNRLIAIAVKSGTDILSKVPLQTAILVKEAAKVINLQSRWI